MKKTLLTVASIVLLASCKKKETAPCNCGIIQSDNVQDYSVVIRNECTNNEKTFYLSQGDWMNAHTGNRYCITNVDKW
jgi:hypothetical protein